MCLPWQPTVPWPCACPWVEMWPWPCDGHVLLCLLLQPHGCLSHLPHQDRAHHLQWGLAGARHPWVLLRSQSSPLLPAGKCHKAEQGHLHSCPSSLILLSLFLRASTLIAELAVGLWGIVTLFSLNARTLSAAYLGAVCSATQFFFIKVLSLT